MKKTIIVKPKEKKTIIVTRKEHKTPPRKPSYKA